GFVTAITPFNFTAIAGNLPTVPALMGNTVVWKPTPTQQVAAHHTMRLLEAAGLPAGVINMVTGDGLAVSRVALTDPDLAGLHFTGSSATFKTLWRTLTDDPRVAAVAVEVVGEGPPEGLEGRRRPGEVQAGQVGVGEGDAGDGEPVAGHHVDHTAGQAGGLEQPHRVVCRDLLGGRRLPDHGVAHERG